MVDAVTGIIAVLADDVQSIHDAVHGDLEARELYAWVDELARKLD